MNFQQMKIKTPTIEMQREVQERLLDMGYWWHDFSGDKNRTKWLGNMTAIYTEKTGQLYRDTETDFEFFNKEENGEEYMLTPQKTFVKVVDYYKQPETPKINIPERYENPKNEDDKAVRDAFDKVIGSMYEPIGLLPKAIHDKQRMYEILEAMRRYVDADKKIPQSWIAELDDLGGEFVEEEF